MIHDVPGRLRVKLSKLKNNPHRLNIVRNLLMVDGVHKVKSNALTGSVIVEYDSFEISSSHLIEILEKNGYTIDSTPVSPSVNQVHEKAVLTLSKATISWLAGRVLEANGLSYIAAFI